MTVAGTGVLGGRVRERMRMLSRAARLTGLGPGPALGIAAVTLAAVALDAAAMALLLPVLHLLGGGELTPATMPPLLRPGLEALRRAGLPPGIGPLLALMLALSAMRIALSHERFRRRANLRRAAVVTLRRRVYEGMLRARLGFVEQQGGAAFLSSLTAEAENTGNLVFSLTAALGHGLHLAMFAVVSLVVAPLLTAFVLAAFAAFALINRRQGQRARALGSEMAHCSQRFSGVVLDRLADLRSVKLNLAQRQEVARFHAVAGDLGDAGRELDRLTAASQARVELAALVTLGGIIAVASLASGTTLPALTLCAFILVRTVPMATQLVNAVQNSRAFLASAERLVGFLEGVEAAQEARGGSRPFVRLERSLELDDVWFTYGDDAVPVLQGLHATARAGRLTVVAGPSGVGKTTLLDIMMGLRDPRRGRVLVDGAPLGSFEVESFRRRSFYLAQRAALFRGTVRENVAYGLDEAPPGAVLSALAGAGAAAFVGNLPRGLETPVGDGQHGLSVGEVRRLLLARALMKGAALLFLDEPTSDLDAANATLLVEHLKALVAAGATVIIASHDPLVIGAADDVVRLGLVTAEPAR